ncbi:methyltransferase domain-containing protein [Nonomuraea jiangxiensis]|uniref:Protein-L-isoaspartate O-methyltransferase n=1 Tax=Nonomuraea jiangxiensis TaxID=633440 RepID=A0A1G8UQJ4_9ACTN|nr:methyltransferase domain-containing protein [Nonomuraea jiangxiensis]SDJ56063.1 protein-L-isoaspartate(D-aspartate) O-methyltransferase [Nonomuraea jiangxiensis]
MTEPDRIEALIREVGARTLVNDAVRRAFHAVHRHLFIPEVGLAAGPDGDKRVIDREADPQDWVTAVYTDMSIVTQLDDGATDLRKVTGDYTSSASAPSTVADLLRWLDPLPGHRVLEVGTGTGWTAALLSHLVGGHGTVTSIEVDPGVAEQAAKNLAACGIRPHLVVGDGAAGCPGQAPYDRVHVTCGVHTVPYAWVEQCRPGAVIVLPYCPGFGENHGLRLVVMRDGTAQGRFPGFASYMMMPSQREPEDRAARRPEDKRWLTTKVDPRTVAFAPAGADLAIAALTGLTSVSAADHDEDGELFRLWLSDPADPYSWGTVEWRPGADEYEVYQVGDRPLWEQVCDAYFRWVSWGEPGRDQFGMTVTPEGQRVWLGAPDRGLT